MQAPLTLGKQFISDTLSAQTGSEQVFQGLSLNLDSGSAELSFFDLVAIQFKQQLSLTESQQTDISKLELPLSATEQLLSFNTANPGIDTTLTEHDSNEALLLQFRQLPNIKQLSTAELVSTNNQNVLQKFNGNPNHRDVQLFVDNELKDIQLMLPKRQLENALNIANVAGLQNPVTMDNQTIITDKPLEILQVGLTDNANRPANPVSVLPKPQVALETQFQQQNWGNALSNRIVWLVTNNIKTADISLNPPELGPVEVRISQSAEQTNVQFFAQHGQVRDAIEDSFPRLRELMQQSGLSLGDAQVSDQSLQQGQRDDGTRPAYISDSVSAPSEEVTVTTSNLVTDSNTLYDYYV